jgi:hypothetical protein
VQTLLSALFSLPTTSSPDGPIAQLPPFTTQLPRAKPLPKPKPPTKWEQFAKAKGIQKKRKDKVVWDEERQEWVNRWGRDGKNKEKEVQWATEVAANADVDHDPAKVARDARKARVAKNERQRLQNMARSQAPGEKEARKSEIDRSLATTRISTASMGRFDKKLEGEKKLKGVKRKVSRFLVHSLLSNLVLLSSTLPNHQQSTRRRPPWHCYRKWIATRGRKRARKLLGAAATMFSTYARLCALLVKGRAGPPLADSRLGLKT